MRSSGKFVAAFLLAAAIGAPAQAQSSQAKDLYTEALTREADLRKSFEAAAAHAPNDTVLMRVRALAGAYEDMARLFPSSSVSDDALWRGALLAADAFWHYGEDQEKTTALRMLLTLTKQFGGGPLAKRAPEQIRRLTAATSHPTTARRPAVPPATAAPIKPPLAVSASSPSPPTVRPASSGTVALTSIKRESLPDALRITLELDREVPFHDERIDGPPRVFLDLQNTRAVASLRDAILPVDDDVVQRVRVGRQLDSRTRVVLDLKTAAPYSVYTLYNPYRVVVDFERSPVASAPPVAPTTATRIAPIAPTTAAKIAPTNEARVAPLAPTTERKISPPDAVNDAPTAAAANTSGSFSLSRQLGLGAARIVIDAGHGGHDPGAKARGLSEADLVLDIALRLEQLLVKQPGVEVVLTRRTDAFVSLEQRTEIANREGADLFLSIHANASADAGARGIETYFLNFAADPEAEAVAARENAGAAKNMRHLPEIVRAIALNNKIDESRDFAAAVQTSLHRQLKKVNRDVRNLGVKQAPFMVLIGATMPSVLAEISFITSRQDANYLKTEKYRQQIAEALLAGVMNYTQSLKKLPSVASR